MKQIILLTILTMGVITAFTACDKPDYQDPRYRSTHNK